MFQGEFEHTIDDKGRLAIPSQFRRKLGDADEPVLVLTVWQQCLAAYPLPAWEQVLATVAQQSRLDPDVIAFKRLFIGRAQECPVDKAGRILIPAGLRRHAQLEKDCFVVGQLEKLEIWDAARWGDVTLKLTDELGANYASLANRGFQL